jgi:cytosine/adenosine deaminase-related metal-dependent hydrolase
MRRLGDRSPYFSRLRDEVARLGGMHNAHLHLDRAGTLDERYFAQAGNLSVLDNSYISLKKKHSLINQIHAGPAYEPEDLAARVEETIDVMVEAGTALADTMVDVTDDRVGLSALELISGIKRRRAGEIELRLAAYSPFGFRDDEPGRWRVFEEGAKRADFIGCLPEADDRADYPDNIGFEEHCVRMLDLARREGKMLHVHTDQRNEASERGTERLVEVMRRHPGPASPDGAPMVWAVHMISPTRYDERRHRRLVDGMLELGIGVVSCPSAALGMRQLRALSSPTDNSIPRILELLEAGVHVRLGSDNVADICSPSTTADLLDEVFVLSAAIRYYEIGALARLAAGLRPDEDQLAAIREHLARNGKEAAKVVEAARAAAS